MLDPISTYRIQFNKDFTLENFENIISYLKDLGIKTIYASPIFEATPGSMHGYDGVNPHRVNPEVGNEQKLKSIGRRLKEEGMNWLQDIVPNHMAYHPKNKWLMDVFEKGSHSQYYTFFDIDWNHPAHPGQVMAPFLGNTLEECIENGEIQVNFQENKFVLQYFELTLPIALKSYSAILPELESKFSNKLSEFSASKRNDQFVTQPKNEVLEEEIDLSFDDEIKNIIDNGQLITRLAEINNNKVRLKEIADQQVFRLCSWKETDMQINYRRFFTINGLICLNIQEQKVFDEYHRYILSLLNEKVIDGLRIDHVDGLYDPENYLKTLRNHSGNETFLVVEKILEPDEKLPSWPIQGNTGYDFLSSVNALLTNQKNEITFTKFYNKLVGGTKPVEDQIREKKSAILFNHMAGELDNLSRLFLTSDLIDNTNDKEILTQHTVREIISELLIECPVYRYYGNKFPLSDADLNNLKNILSDLSLRKPELAPAIAVFQKAFTGTSVNAADETSRKALHFYERMMQFSGPLMAKGVEDTLMYTYNRFLASNEVGSAPENFGISPEIFHKQMAERQESWPLSLNGTATHDTKRGEDVNARLNVISDLPNEWTKAVTEWRGLNKELKEQNAPDVNDEYFIYQALAGIYPLSIEDEQDFGARFEAYLVKALREAKTHTNWATPDEAYEKAATDFAKKLLDKQRPFWTSFTDFLSAIKDFGIVNSLAKVLLKFTCPGVPDIYQGCEFWDLSMVDPDNRRQVDFGKRRTYLQKISESAGGEKLLKELWEKRDDAGIKLWLTHELLKLRKESGDFFCQAEYLPLKIAGKYKDNILAFARKYKQVWYVSVVPLNLASICRQQNSVLTEFDWKDTSLVIPEKAPLSMYNILSHSKSRRGKQVFIKDLFQNLPIAFFKLEIPENERSAGILMHITSLPSPFGIGDLGKEAYTFADFLNAAYQKYWQLLPLNITTQDSAHSPYSSISSMAGNTLLISPEMLAQEGLLVTEELAKDHIKNTDEVFYKEAAQLKKEFLSKAFAKFKNQFSNTQLDRDFLEFVEKEYTWIRDFALFVVIKAEFEGRPWYDWPKEYKLRNTDSLDSFGEQHAEAIEQVKWEQFIFFKQWNKLKAYCNDLNIQLFGDLPFYVSYDSADVWANPSIFSLNANGEMTGMAGVPPDYFNEDGQLWGMPVFNWSILKESNYEWWIQRIKKNLELYDVLRLDHFRAFADFWEVPAGEKTAKNGTWKPGPGKDFFEALKTSFGKLPFIAEDLGDINQEVHVLRDDFNLPGMKVLQFAFGNDIAESIYIPHNYISNYIAYTGTHDNNTTIGWFRQDAGKTERRNIENYIGIKPTEKNIHLLLAKLAYASVAKTAILPIQDVLGLNEDARMNIPASMEKNWLWRLTPGQISDKVTQKLREWVLIYNRY